MKQILSLYKILLVLLLFTGRAGQAQCIAGFTYTPGVNGVVYFTSVSTSSSGAFTSYLWNFGNNITNTTVSTNISITYTSSGVYTITLTAMGPCNASYTQAINVTWACVLNPNFSANVGNGGLVNFSNASSNTLSTSTYSWDYGDGNTGTSFAHVYTVTGNYNPTLTITNSPSCITYTTHPIYVNACAPGMTASVLSATNAAGNVSFTNTSVGTGTNTAFKLYTKGPAPSTSTVQIYSGPFFNTTSYTYSANGTYSVNLVIYNTIGPTCTDTSQNIISVTNYTPPCSGTVNLFANNSGTSVVTFSNTSSALPVGTTFFIDYGDGNATPTPAFLSPHSYTANGTYSVVLVASNSVTPICSPSKTIVVSISSFCSTSFSVTVGPTGTASFVANIIPASANTSYTWDFGNSTSSVTPNSFILANYTASGIYTVYLTSYNGTCTATYANTISVITPTVIPCNIVSAFSHTVGATGFVELVSTSTGTSASTQYFWRFGDGYTTTGNPASHLYSSNSSYIVKLIVTDGACTDTSAQSINITGTSCHANAGFLLDISSIPFEWNATPAYPWNVSAATWYWGDGTTSNQLYSSHIYSQAGNYNICLTVTVSCGDSATYCSTESLFKPSGSDESAVFLKINVIAPGSTVTGISQRETNAINFDIFPNPTNGEFNLRLNGVKSTKLKTAVYNVVGTLVYVSENETSNGELTKSINLGNLPDGVYFIRINSDNKTYTRKVILNK